MLTPEEAERLNEAKRLAEAATPGLWIARSDGRPELNNVSHYVASAGGELVCECNGYGTDRESNAAFIAAAHEVIPWLLGMVERQQAALLAADKAAREEAYADATWVIKEVIAHKKSQANKATRRQIKRNLAVEVDFLGQLIDAIDRRRAAAREGK